jgi:hypothetical protein
MEKLEGLLVSKYPDEFGEPEQLEQPSEPAEAIEAEALDTEEEYYGEEEEQYAEEDYSEAEEPQEPDVFTVKAAGGDHEVTLEELKKSFQLQADWTRKSQAVADQRKENDALQERLNDLMGQYSEKLDTVLKAIDSQEPEVDLEDLKRRDPQQYAVALAEKTAREADAGKIREEKARIDQELEAKRAEEFQEVFQEEQRRLLSAIPEWKDSEVARTEQERLVEYGRGLGFSEQELGAVYDHRYVKLLRDAMLYSQVAESADGVAKKRKAAPRITPGSRARKRPGAALTKERHRLRDELAQTGGERAAQALIETFLED